MEKLCEAKNHSNHGFIRNHYSKGGTDQFLGPRTKPTKSSVPLLPNIYPSLYLNKDIIITSKNSINCANLPITIIGITGMSNRSSYLCRYLISTHPYGLNLPLLSASLREKSPQRGFSGKIHGPAGTRWYPDQPFSFTCYHHEIPAGSTINHL